MSKPVPVFEATVNERGNLVLTRPYDFRLYLKRLQEKPVEVVVRRRRSKRSLEQNAWTWGVAYPILGETLGYDRDELDELHYALVAKWGGTHLDEKLGVQVANKRSSQLSTAEFSDYMEWLVRFAAKEFGCVIPLPNEAGIEALELRRESAGT